MVAPAIGGVIVVPFPFSDLSQSKLRPAIVLAASSRDDWILCQITSNAYADPKAIEIADGDFRSGSLKALSYARPGKVFTAHQSLVTRQIGVLTDAAYKRIVSAVVALLQANLPP